MSIADGIVLAFAVGAMAGAVCGLTLIIILEVFGRARR